MENQTLPTHPFLAKLVFPGARRLSAVNHYGSERQHMP